MKSKSKDSCELNSVIEDILRVNTLKYPIDEMAVIISNAISQHFNKTWVYFSIDLGKIKRNKRILQLKNRGLTYTQISDIIGLSRSGCFLVVKNHNKQV